MTAIEEPTGWPFDAEGHMEMWAGCPHWSGGPWGPQDVARADRLLAGWIALVGPDGYGMTLVVPGRPQERVWIDRGYAPVEEAPSWVSDMLSEAPPAIRRPRPRRREVEEGPRESPDVEHETAIEIANRTWESFPEETRRRVLEQEDAVRRDVRARRDEAPHDR